MLKHISQTGVHKEMQRHKTPYKRKDRLKINIESSKHIEKYNKITAMDCNFTYT